MKTTMKMLFKLSYSVMLLAGLFFISGCDDNSEILVDPTDPTDPMDTTPELVLAEGGGDKNLTITVDDNTPSSVSVKVSLTSTNESMKRLYITQDVTGAGAEPYEITLANVDLKGDKSLDVAAANSKEVTYNLPLEVLSNITEGTVVYQLWATSGRGDHRNPDKRFAVGTGTITFDYGGANPAAPVKSFEAKMFAVPLADGTSDTFISVLDGKLHKLSEGEELAALWDFGYYWLNSPGASFASTNDYPALFDHDNDANTDLVAIATLTETAQDDLNKFYFATTETTSEEFDAITVAGDLSSLNVSTSSDQRVTNLAEGDIVAFLDSYGNKGLIRVNTIVSGFGSDGAITIDIKVQP